MGETDIQRLSDDLSDSKSSDLSNEAEDSFPVDNSIPTASLDPQVIVEMDSLAMLSNSYRNGPPSIANTDLASSMGSVILRLNDAFLKDITFFKTTEDLDWSIQLEQSQDYIGKQARSKSKPRILVSNLGGVICLSRIKNGDCLKSINGHKVGPSLNAELAFQRMTQSMEKEGVLSIATANKEFGDDVLVQSTIIKPRPDMTYEEMGMEVWFWGVLCIHKIKKGSPFSFTVLRETDHILSINDIKCDKLIKPEQFAEIVNTLTFDVTITVLRRKQRWTGAFK
jgi:hypothetical protein